MEMDFSVGKRLKRNLINKNQVPLLNLNNQQFYYHSGFAWEKLWSKKLELNGKWGRQNTQVSLFDNVYYKYCDYDCRSDKSFAFDPSAQFEHIFFSKKRKINKEMLRLSGCMEKQWNLNLIKLVQQKDAIIWARLCTCMWNEFLSDFTGPYHSYGVS